MKYIILRVKYMEKMTKEIPIIFPNDLSHKDVAEAMTHVKDLQGCMVVSAGEISSMAIDQTQVTPSGSVSLELKKGRDEDGALIALHDYFHGLADA